MDNNIPSTAKEGILLFIIFNILPNDSETSDILTDNPLIFFRRHQSIRGFLANSALKKNSLLPAHTFSCCNTRCCTCAFLNSIARTFGPASGFITRHHFICTSSIKIIYCISCSKCCKLYVGETGQRLSDRFAEKVRSLKRNDVDKRVSRHFNGTNLSF